MARPAAVPPPRPGEGEHREPADAGGAEPQALARRHRLGPAPRARAAPWRCPPGPGCLPAARPPAGHHPCPRLEPRAHRSPPWPPTAAFGNGLTPGLLTPCRAAALFRRRRPGKHALPGARSCGRCGILQRAPRGAASRPRCETPPRARRPGWLVGDGGPRRCPSKEARLGRVAPPPRCCRLPTGRGHPRLPHGRTGLKGQDAIGCIRGVRNSPPTLGAPFGQDRNRRVYGCIRSAGVVVLRSGRPAARTRRGDRSARGRRCRRPQGRATMSSGFQVWSKKGSNGP